MPSSLRKALVGCAAVIAFAAWGGALAGCAQEGKTPTCVNSVTDDGVVGTDADGDRSAPDDMCNGFGACIIDGDVRPAAECCVDENGDPFTGNRLTACLYGYGAIDLADGAGGAGGTGGAGGGG